jgi:hypothetical protein
MKTNDIATAYLAYTDGSGGKRRPLLIVDTDREYYSIFKITSQYEQKSPAIKANYFEIKDWKSAGLFKASYIDTLTLVKLPKAIYRDKPKMIGELQQADIKALNRFLEGKKD